jgi:choline-sulfatase
MSPQPEGSPSSRPFRRWLLVVWPALLVAGLGESFGVALAAEAGRRAAAVAIAFAEVALYTLFGWFVLAAVLSAALALAAGGAGRGSGRAVLSIGEGYTRADLLAAALVVVPIHVLFAYFVTFEAISAFKNRELLALLVVAVTALAAIAGFAVFVACARFFARIRERSRRPRAVRLLPLLCAVFVALPGVGWIIAENASGLVQLETWLVLAPVLGLTALALSGRLRLAERFGDLSVQRVLVGSGVLSLASTVLISFADPTLPNTLARHGAWSKYAIRAARSLTDFDRDGYSSWFAGGDCAPFDPEVHPGAPEVPEDGKDNNCIGGDARRDAPINRPAWHDRVPQSVDKRMNLVVVTIETLRHDHVSFLGYARDTTPRLRDFARDAWRFRRMYSSAPMTRLALSSLFSSFSPSEIQWAPQPAHKRMRKIGAKTPWLPATLRQAGYQTLAILTDFRAFTSAESAGFERGFDEYDTSTRLRYSGGTMYGFPGEEQVTKAIARLGRAERPFFLWLHLFEPHFVYEQPPAAPLFGGDERARYDAEIWEADRQIGRLLDHLRAAGELDRTIVFVTGDHGEAFGEHGDRWHGSNLHDPQVRTASLLRVPGMAGSELDVAVTFTDVAPTLLNLLGIRDGFEDLRGRNLLPLLLGGEIEPRRFVIEAFSVDDGHAFMMGLVEMPYKLIYVEEGRKLELFDLGADPEERSPLASGALRHGPALENRLFEYLESTAKRY